MNGLLEETVEAPHIGETTPAPLRLIKTACLLAPPADVFAVVSDHLGMGAWFPMVNQVQVDHSNAEVAGGQGTVRHCTLSNGVVLTENIIAFDPPRLFGYAVADGNAFGVQNHRASIKLETDVAGNTILTWKQHFNHAAVELLVKEISTMLDSGIQGLIDRFGGEFLATTFISNEEKQYA